MLNRRKAGFIFPLRFYSDSPRLIVPIRKQEERLFEMLSGFTKPFTPALWGTLFACSIVTGLIYWLFETSMVWTEHGENPGLRWHHGY